jgi:hypothetical protein
MVTVASLSVESVIGCDPLLIPNVYKPTVQGEVVSREFKDVLNITVIAGLSVFV